MRAWHQHRSYSGSGTSPTDSVSQVLDTLIMSRPWPCVVLRLHRLAGYHAVRSPSVHGLRQPPHVHKHLH